MRVVSPEVIQGKKVLLRLDIDVPIENGKVLDDFRLKAALPTLNMCLEYAQKVFILGHIGRPNGAASPELSVAPILDWLEETIEHKFLDEEKLFLLENLRFEKGEEEASVDYAKSLVTLVDPEGTGNCIFVNEAFASYHPAASTTVLPTLLPAFAGLRFKKEVDILQKIKEIPAHPLLVIIGGAKVEDKLPVAKAMSKIADAVLIGGKVAGEVKESQEVVPPHVFVGTLNEEGTDMTPETILGWQGLITGAKMIVWNGPLGKIEELGSAEGTSKLAQMILGSRAEIIIGGGDTIGFLGQVELLDKFESRGFVSTGGGAMLKFLETGTLPSIEALNRHLSS